MSRIERRASERITEEVTSWPGVTAGLGSRGEFGFKVGGREIGHLHGDRVAHFGFPKDVWHALFAEGRIDYHPVFPGRPGFGARDIESDADVDDVIALMRLNYDRVVERHGLPGRGRRVTPQQEDEMPEPHIHRHTTGQDGALVNAYLVDTSDGIVAIDGTLTVTDGRALRMRLETLGKPLLAVLVTHAHPDHYGGIVELIGSDDVPVIATAGVDAVIRRDDALKEEILRPMFGDEWPRERMFPTRLVSDGDTVDLGGTSFTVLDLGPGESPHDSIWFLGDEWRTVFLGDQVYDRKHAYLADGFFEGWLGHIERLQRELPADATLHIGHGGPVTPARFDEQRLYVETFVDAVRNADWSEPDNARAAVVERMTTLLPTDELRFLMELSIDPVAARLGIVQPV